MNCYKILLLCLLPLTGFGQSDKDFVSLNSADTQICPESGNILLMMDFQIVEGYHIQADEVLNDNFIPTELELLSLEDLAICEVAYSEAKTIFLDENEPLLVFNKQFTITAIFLPPFAESESYCLEAVLSYQTCDGQKCFFPRELYLEIPMEIKV